jgi:hypothetical protein
VWGKQAMRLWTLDLAVEPGLGLQGLGVTTYDKR